jgi:hypothetical protein
MFFGHGCRFPVRLDIDERSAAFGARTATAAARGAEGLGDLRPRCTHSLHYELFGFVL